MVLSILGSLQVQQLFQNINCLVGALQIENGSCIIPLCTQSFGIRGMAVCPVEFMCFPGKYQRLFIVRFSRIRFSRMGSKKVSQRPSAPVIVFSLAGVFAAVPQHLFVASDGFMIVTIFQMPECQRKLDRLPEDQEKRDGRGLGAS